MARKHSITSLINDETKERAERLRDRGRTIQESTSSLFNRIIIAGLNAIDVEEN